MARPTWMVALGGLMVLAAGEAAAQYSPPYGYNPPPYDYNRPPPSRYAPDDYYAPPPPRRDVGLRCGARAFTPDGPRRIVCPLRRPRPLGRPCDCPPPPPPPGYAPGPPLEGRVIP